MKLLHFYGQDGEARLGIKTENGVVDVRREAERAGIAAPAAIKDIAQGGTEALRLLESIAAGAEMTLDEASLTLAPPSPAPGKILCVGLNYRSHAAETKGEPPKYPMLFCKTNDALTSHLHPVPKPKNIRCLDYEAELVIVVGRGGYQFSEAEAPAHILGYTCGNDLSARDAQFVSSQWLIGKSFPYFAPTGPYLATGDSLDPENLSISCRLNGRLVQSANTSDMIFSPRCITAYASQYFRLEPGDLIFTGTPAGVILGVEKGKRVWMVPGDRTDVAIEGIGTLTNTVSE